MPEFRLSIEQTRTKFEEVKRTISHALFGRDRFIPRGTTNLITVLTGGIEMLSDEEYFAHYYNRFAIPSTTAEAVAANRDFFERFDKVKGTYIPPLTQHEKKRILIKESFVSDPANKTETVVLYLLEELSHSFYEDEPPVLIDTLPVSTARFWPYQSKRELLDKLYRERRDLFGKDDVIDPQHVFAQKVGFVTLYLGDDLTEDSHYIQYTSSKIQIAMEEARAAVLQSIFLAKVIGTKEKPFGNNEEQVLYGIQSLSRNMLQPDSSYQIFGTRQIYGLGFLLSYCSVGRCKDRLNELMLMLHRSDPDAFFEDLHNKHSPGISIFNRLIEEIVAQRWSD